MEFDSSNQLGIMDASQATRSAGIRMDIDEYLASLVASGAVKVARDDSSTFGLRNGQTSYVYVDHGEMLCEPEFNQPMVRALESYINMNFDLHDLVLVNVDSKSSPHLAGAIASRLGLRQAVLVPENVRIAERGTNRRLRLPQSLSGSETFLLLDDVLTPFDRTVKDVATLLVRELHKTFGSAEHPDTHALVGLARQGKKIAPLMKEHKVRPHWLVDLEDVLELMWSKLTTGQRDGLRREFFNEGSGEPSKSRFESSRSTTPKGAA